VTERAPRDRCRLPAPSWCLDGRVATSFPTAARTAAADSGLPRGRRALSGALHTDAQVRVTQPAERRLQSASLMPRPDSPSTASSDDSTRTTEPKTLRRTRRNHQDHELPKTDPLSMRPPNPKTHTHTKTSRRPRAAQNRPTLNAATEPKNTPTTKTPPRRPRRNHQQHTKKKKTTRRNHQHTRRRNHHEDEEEDRLGVLRALIFLLASCSALLRAPAGSFEKGGIPQFQRLAPMKRPMTNNLHDRRAGKTGGKIRAPIGIPSCFSLAFSESLVPFAL